MIAMKLAPLLGGAMELSSLSCSCSSGTASSPVPVLEEHTFLI